MGMHSAKFMNQFSYTLGSRSKSTNLKFSSTDVPSGITKEKFDGGVFSKRASMYPLSAASIAGGTSGLTCSSASASEFGHYVSSMISYLASRYSHH